MRRVVQAREIWAQENDKLVCGRRCGSILFIYNGEKKVKCIIYMRASDVQKTKCFFGDLRVVCCSFYMDRKNNTMIQQVCIVYRYIL